MPSDTYMEKVEALKTYLAPKIGDLRTSLEELDSEFLEGFAEGLDMAEALGTGESERLYDVSKKGGMSELGEVDEAVLFDVLRKNLAERSKVSSEMLTGDETVKEVIIEFITEILEPDEEVDPVLQNIYIANLLGRKMVYLQGII